MRKLVLALGSFVCISRCFGKSGHSSQHDGGVRELKTSGVLARLVLAMKPEAAFSPSPLAVLARDSGVLPRRARPIRFADDDPPDRAKERKDQKIQELKEIMQDVKNMDRDAIKFKEIRVQNRMRRIQDKEDQEAMRKQLNMRFDGAKERKYLQQLEEERAEKDYEEQVKKAMNQKEAKAAREEEKWRKEFGYEEKEAQPARFNRQVKRNSKLEEEWVFDPVQRATVPDNGLIVVAGASTALGRMVVSALGAVGKNWTVRALVPTDSNVDLGAGVETVAFQTSTLPLSLEKASAVIVITEAIGGEGGITKETMPALMEAVGPSRRLVMTSVHGVDRIDTDFGWKMKNMMGGGKVEQERYVEEELVLRAKNCSGSYTVMRIGEIEDDSGSQVTPEKLASRPSCRAAIAPGDKLEGKVPMSAVASLLAQSLREDAFINATFSIGDAEAPDKGSASASDRAYWDDQFVKLLGPDIYRSSPVNAGADWVRAWADEFLKQGKLVTPTDLVAIDQGVMLRFKKRESTYKPRSQAELNAKIAAEKSNKAGKSDGALVIVAEKEPSPRIRVARAEMEEGIIVKLMSEEEVIRQLEIDVGKLQKEQNR